MADCSKTVDFFNECLRMCSSKETAESCSRCLLGSISLCDGYEFRPIAQNVIDQVQKWSDEHPVKSFLDDFKEKHPNAILSCKGKPKACRRLLYGGECREDRDCLKCWKEEINE